MNTLRTVLTWMARQLRVSADVSSVFEHSGMIGASREAFVRDGLRLLIPGHIEVVHGAKIINANEAPSNAYDLLLKDRSWPAFFSLDRQALVPAELVFGIIEVSSDLSTEKLKEDCEKIRAAKQVQKTAFTGRDVVKRYRSAYGRKYPYVPTVGMLIAYNGAKLETLGAALEDWCRDEEVPVEQRPDAVFILGKGSIIWFKNGPTWTPEPDACLGAFPVRDEDDVLPLLALFMHQHFTTAWVPQWRLSDYVGGPRGASVSKPPIWKSGPL